MALRNCLMILTIAFNSHLAWTQTPALKSVQRVEPGAQVFQLGGHQFLAVGTRENPQGTYPTRCEQAYSYFVRIVELTPNLLSQSAASIDRLSLAAKIPVVSSDGLEPCQPMPLIRIAQPNPQTVYLATFVGASIPRLALYRLDWDGRAIRPTRIENPEYPSFEGYFLGSMVRGFDPQIFATSDDVVLLLPKTYETLGAYSLMSQRTLFETQPDGVVYVGSGRIPYQAQMVGTHLYVVDGSSNSGVRVYRLPEGEIVGQIAWHQIASRVPFLQTCLARLNPQAVQPLQLLLACENREGTRLFLYDLATTPVLVATEFLSRTHFAHAPDFFLSGADSIIIGAEYEGVTEDSYRSRVVIRSLRLETKASTPWTRPGDFSRTAFRLDGTSLTVAGHEVAVTYQIRSSDQNWAITQVSSLPIGGHLTSFEQTIPRFQVGTLLYDLIGGVAGRGPQNPTRPNATTSQSDSTLQILRRN